MIRFCRSLGFKGFQDFKIRLAQSVVPTVRTIHESVDENSEVPDLVQRVFEANIDAVRSTLKTLDFLTVGAVVDADEFDLMTDQSSLLVHAILPDLVRQTGRLPVGGERTGEGQAVPNFDGRLLRCHLRLSINARERRRDSRTRRAG